MFNVFQDFIGINFLVCCLVEDVVPPRTQAGLIEEGALARGLKLMEGSESGRKPRVGRDERR